MSSANGLTVFIIDDDGAVRDALALLLGVHGYSVALFADAESFLRAYRAEWLGCLLVDIRMPGMNGLELQQAMLRNGRGLPVIIMTGHGDVESAREAFRAQAIDFLEKPIDQGRLLQAIEEALHRLQTAQEAECERAALNSLLGALSPREREVMDLVVSGKHNREVAELLNISPRTVEVHKARVIAKLQVKGVPDLVRLGLLCQAAAIRPTTSSTTTSVGNE